MKLLLQRLFVVLMVTLFIIPTQALALTKAQRFEIERRPFYDPTDCSGGGSSTAPGTSAATPGSVVVIGDSIMDATKPVLEKKINESGNGWRANINSHFSRPLKGNPSSPESDGITVINQMLEDIKTARAVVIELGTNGSLNATDMSAAIAAIKGAPSSANLYWVNTAQVGRPAYQGVIDNANSNIQAQSGTLGFKIIDWNKEVAAHPDYIIPISDPGSLGVHPSAAGIEGMAKLIAESVTGGGSTAPGTSATPALTTTPSTPATPTTPNVPNPAEVTSQGNNKGYDGGDVWSQAQLAQVEANRPFYEKAATKAGIDWRIIAPLHLNETGLGRTNPGNGQGIYQDYGRLGNGGANYPPGAVSDEEFQRQTDWVAGFIKSKADANPEGLKDLGTPDGIKETMWGFNGKAGVYRQQAQSLGFDPAKQGFEGSPYVMNKADERRDPAKNPNGWGQIKVDNGGIQYPANDFYGSFIHFTALGGQGGGAAAAAGGGCSGGEAAAAGGSTATGDLGNRVVQIAEKEMFAGAAEKPPGCNCGPDVEKYTAGRQFAWCASFVSWVYKEAGAPFDQAGWPEKWLITYVPTLQDYLKNSGKFDYHPKGDGYTPKPGDIIIYLSNGASHTGLVDKVNGNTVTSLDGNWADKVTTHDFDLQSYANLTGFGTPKGQ